MNPIPCAHCGLNFMRPIPNPEAPKLCNNCLLKEERRNPSKKECMKTIDIKITCPVQIHNKIEEHCINNGISFSEYFLSLYKIYELQREEHREKGGDLAVEEDSISKKSKKK